MAAKRVSAELGCGAHWPCAEEKQKSGALPSLRSPGGHFRAGERGHRRAGGIIGTYQNGEERREREGGREREREDVSRISWVTAAPAAATDAPADATIMTFLSNQKEIGQK